MLRARVRSSAGCDTCRRRRKKCDEQKSQCAQCKRLNLVCTWGLIRRGPKSMPTTRNRSKGGIVVGFGHDAFPSPLNWSPSTFLGSMDVGQVQSFQYFIQVISPNLSGFCHWEAQIWRCVVPQIAYESCSLRHAICALGSIYQSLTVSDKPLTESIPNTAMQEYIYSLRSLRSACDDNGPHATLVFTSILLVLFEALRGRYSSSLIHLRNLSRLFSLVQPASVPPTAYGTHGLNYLHLARLMANRLSRQSIELNLAIDKHNIIPPIICHQLLPHAFSTVEHAMIYFETFLGDALVTVNLGRSSAQHDIGEGYIDSLVTQKFLRWKALFEDLKIRSTSDVIQPSTWISLRTLEMYTSALDMLLHLDYSAGELAYDAWERTAFEIVSIATTIVDMTKRQGSDYTCSQVPQLCGDETAKSKRSDLTFTVCGLTPLWPLYVVAHRCRDPTIRRRAVDVLAASAWRDGLWTSHLTARVCSRIIEIEEARAAYLSGSKLIDRAHHVPRGARLAHVWPRILHDDVLSMDYISCNGLTSSPNPKILQNDTVCEVVGFRSATQ